MSDIRELLGPGGHEVGCDECFELLDAYVEIEIATDEDEAARRITGMREHLQGCPACREEHDSLRDLVRDT
jgi:predicted anti-sigma-YlaC factor YlaD